ncbi:hypothetical protein [Streptomyces sp. 7N604]|uniref:hypothetical protein n=1 Tax=Streptomyces sp. 7N604 TaxID=3457415 RepID=UPI003FD39988
MTLSQLLERWLEVADLELTTREAHEGYIARTINPALGDQPLRKLQHRVDLLDRMYVHLRRCSLLCDGKPFIEHRTKRPHDCKSPGKRPCGQHICRPASPATCHRINSIISAAFNYAISWGWVERNPAEYAHLPKLRRKRARPPAPEKVAQLLNLAFERSPPAPVVVRSASCVGRT